VEVVFDGAEELAGYFPMRPAELGNEQPGYPVGLLSSYVRRHGGDGLAGGAEGAELLFGSREFPTSLPPFHAGINNQVG
jgi:hypothetical protein